MKKPEILAPAGTMEALHAAVNSGADAVYLGGERFGARAFAGNFMKNELIEGIRYAHLYGVKVYLTVNTLFRNEEIDGLYDYLLPYYEAGLDAVIVQDFGVMQYIHEFFPELPIHASTQMTITTPYAYKLLQAYGVTRIVPARELSVKELSALKADTLGNAIPELEVFVQGALCLCYSGQCLMSSFIGGRSGNRGRCAGCCRLPYKISDERNNNIDLGGQYLLSPKDLCGIEMIPELINAGVDSFKIEGRMKKPEYVAACVRSYRSCVDRFFELDKDIKSWEKYTQKYIDEMAEIFNRGGFNKGYFLQNNGRNMMSFDAPGHMGVYIGSVDAVKKNSIVIKLKCAIHKGDILVIDIHGDEITMTSNVDGKSGNFVNLNVSKVKMISHGMKVYRKYNHTLENELKNYYEKDNKIKVKGTVKLIKGERAELIVSVISDKSKKEVVSYGGIVEEASSKPVIEETVVNKIGQTGDSRFEFFDIETVMDDNIFVPVKSLKDLRREAFSLLENELEKEYLRKQVKDKNLSKQYSFNSDNKRVVRALVSSFEQMDAVRNYSDDIKIAVDLQYFSKSDIISLMNEHKEYNYALPMILNDNSLRELDELPLDSCKSLIIRNIDELSYLKTKGYTGEIIADYSLYSMNDWAADFIRSQFQNTVMTIPVELNEKQIKSLSYRNGNFELIVYGYQPLMVTAQCFQEMTKGCSKGSNSVFTLQDRKKQYFRTKAICKYCYNILYNGVPTVIFNKVSEDISYGGNIRFHFTYEKAGQVSEILDAYYNKTEYKGEYTRGHFVRGVE